MEPFGRAWRTRPSAGVNQDGLRQMALDRNAGGGYSSSLSHSLGGKGGMLERVPGRRVGRAIRDCPFLSASTGSGKGLGFRVGNKEALGQVEKGAESFPSFQPSQANAQGTPITGCLMAAPRHPRTASLREEEGKSLEDLGCEHYNRGALSQAGPYVSQQAALCGVGH